MHVDDVIFGHKKEIDNLKADYLTHQQRILHDSRDVEAQLEDQITALKLMYEASS